MANKNKPDPGINSVQKIITLGMIGFMAYIFFTQDRNMQRVDDEAEKDIAPKAVNVIITDTVSGNQIKSNLNAGKILIGKWELELAPEPDAADELSIDASEFLSEPNETAPLEQNSQNPQNPIPEIVEEVK